TTFTTLATETTTTATTLSASMRLRIAQQLHIHRLVQNASTRKVLQYFTRHTFRQFDSGVRSKQLDVTDVTAADVAFVSNRANDMTNFNTIIAAHFNAVQLHVTNITTFTTRTIFTVATRATVVTIARTTVITVTEFTFRTHRRIWRN